MQNSEPVWRHVDAKQDAAIELSDRVWGMPELAYTETRSAAEHTAYLNAEGFRVTENLAGIPTAMMGEAGEEGPVIAILGEFDALPGLSNESGIAEHKPVPGDGHGHACGHNLLGAASLLAATAVKDYLAANGLKGRVRYYGCPAEEGGAAKGFMARAGLFDDVDIAISWHPASFAGVNEPVSLANTRIDFTFHGRASHAAASPHLGRSALDAVELMSVGVNYLREHIPSESRIHYAYLDAGGVAPNVVQAKAKVRYLIRASDVAALRLLVERVRKIADGAALMTETRVETQVVSAVSNLLGNDPLEKLMQDNLDRLGPPPFDAEDLATAKKFQDTLSKEDIASAFRKMGMPHIDAALTDAIVPLDSRRAPMVGSTDVGDVSWVVPTVQARGATHAIGTPLHSWQATAQGKLPHAHKGLVHVAKVMAGTAVDALRNPAIIEAAKADHAAKAGGPYVSPLPADATPPIGMSLTV
ncbi:M20 family metallopeptidase [Roseococcus pinisoli]|uniref:Amidohydrolase n=1 Tax=Roseococcus pinisoli TaxID=2835040 RepID=A0ABS5QIR5_9PROT|nr:M20 family metallopeptidase [Roseococcus pinisoli]MBS7812810.1 amidohydrolase [Roseococcus pinisoli]